MNPIEIITVTVEDLETELHTLALREGYESTEALKHAIQSGEISADSWTAWEFRGLNLMLEAELAV